MSAAVATRPAASSKLTANQLPAWTSGVVLAVSLAAAASLFVLTGSFGVIRMFAVTLVVYGIIIVTASAIVEGSRKATGPAGHHAGHQCLRPGPAAAGIAGHLRDRQRQRPAST